MSINRFRPGETWGEYLQRIIPAGAGCEGCPFIHKDRCANWDEPICDGKNQWCRKMMKVER